MTDTDALAAYIENEIRNEPELGNYRIGFTISEWTLIVAALRRAPAAGEDEIAKLITYLRACSSPHGKSLSDVMRQAADTIARLTRERDELKAELSVALKD